MAHEPRCEPRFRPEFRWISWLTAFGKYSDLEPRVSDQFRRLPPSMGEARKEEKNLNISTTVPKDALA